MVSESRTKTVDQDNIRLSHVINKVDELSGRQKLSLRGHGDLGCFWTDRLDHDDWFLELRFDAADEATIDLFENAPCNALYMSWRSQNKMISWFANQIQNMWQRWSASPCEWSRHLIMVPLNSSVYFFVSSKTTRLGKNFYVSCHLVPPLADCTLGLGLNLLRCKDTMEQARWTVLTEVCKRRWHAVLLSNIYASILNAMCILPSIFGFLSGSVLYEAILQKFVRAETPISSVEKVNFIPLRNSLCRKTRSCYHILLLYCLLRKIFAAPLSVMKVAILYFKASKHLFGNKTYVLTDLCLTEPQDSFFWGHFQRNRRVASSGPDSVPCCPVSLASPWTLRTNKGIPALCQEPEESLWIQCQQNAEQIIFFPTTQRSCQILITTYNYNEGEDAIAAVATTGSFCQLGTVEKSKRFVKNFRCFPQKPLLLFPTNVEKVRTRCLYLVSFKTPFAMFLWNLMFSRKYFICICWRLLFEHFSAGLRSLQ